MPSTNTTQQMGHVVGTLGLSFLLPGVDTLLLVCACAGGMFFVVMAKELALWQRFVLVPFATFLGYIAAFDAQEYIGLRSAYLAAFIVGALGIALLITLLSKLENGDIPPFK